MLDEIINEIAKNRISTTEICDVMNKTGALTGIQPITSGQFAVGRVKYVFAHCGTNYLLHKQLADIDKDCIVFVDAIDCESRAVFGDLVSKYLQLYCNTRAIVTNGLMRDAHTLIKERRPVWCAGVTPIGCHNFEKAVPADIEKITAERKAIYDNSVMVCDDSGVAVLTAEWLNNDLLKKLKFIEALEDVWYYCVDTLKWSTYETVALKKYLDNTGDLPPALRNKLLENER
jgi:4-hydroxy-4-methyl-2-oxoglutarate aldolase